MRPANSLTQPLSVPRIPVAVLGAAKVVPLQLLGLNDLGEPLAELRVDGGAAANDLLMQRQADLLGVPCVRPTIIETSSKKKLAGDPVQIGDVCFKRDGVYAMELGGPEVGRGCGGRGIIHGFELLEKLGFHEWGFDYVLLDFLGDVVCGGFGLPIARVVLAANANRVVPELLASGRYTPRTSLATLANAMDVGAPSNADSGWKQNARPATPVRPRTAPNSTASRTLMRPVASGRVAVRGMRRSVSRSTTWLKTLELAPTSPTNRAARADRSLGSWLSASLQILPHESVDSFAHVIRHRYECRCRLWQGSNIPPVDMLQREPQLIHTRPLIALSKALDDIQPSRTLRPPQLRVVEFELRLTLLVRLPLVGHAAIAPTPRLRDQQGPALCKLRMRHASSARSGNWCLR